MSSIEKRIKSLCEYLIGRLTEIGFEFQTPDSPGERFGIVNVRVEKHREVADLLRKKRIIVAPRVGGIRVSPHFFNTKEDIDILVKELRGVTLRNQQSP